MYLLQLLRVERFDTGLLSFEIGDRTRVKFFIPLNENRKSACKIERRDRVDSMSTGRMRIRHQYDIIFSVFPFRSGYFTRRGIAVRRFAFFFYSFFNFFLYFRQTTIDASVLYRRLVKAPICLAPADTWV